MPIRLLSVVVAALLQLATGLAQGGLVFNFTSTGDPRADAAFAMAGARWSAIIADDLTLTIDAAFAPLSSGTLGSTRISTRPYLYGTVRGALLADRKSADDHTAVSALQYGPAISMLINRTTDSPQGAGSATPYLDDDGGANNLAIVMTSANARAIGLGEVSSTIRDASVSFSTQYGWDFDPRDGIDAGQFDFVGVATHELGHALGFISGVDLLDLPPDNGVPGAEDDYIAVTTLDLFRHSDDSFGAGRSIIDWTADARDKYFSIDGGITPIARFATGVHAGDGRQASHWKDGFGIGIMDPTGSPGESLAISPTDIRALDVIGWDLAGLSVSEPDGLTLFLIVVLAAGMVGRRRRRSVQAARRTRRTQPTVKLWPNSSTIRSSPTGRPSATTSPQRRIARPSSRRSRQPRALDLLIEECGESATVSG